MTTLTFFGGVNEIGGNKIFVRDGDTSVFLDFGKSFGVWGRFFEEFLQPTSSKGIEPFLKTGLLPDIPGIYRPDLLEFAGLKSHDDPAVDAILLSHAHQDHASYISFIDERVPVYCSPTTKAVIEAVQTVGQPSLENEITCFTKRPRENKQPKIERDFQTVNGKTKVGSIEVQFFPVDHSIPGACGMILHCSDQTIVYSGDLRLHGTKGHTTAEFAETAAIEKPDVFLCEGTRINTTENHGEAYVKANAGKLIQETKGLAIADFSWKDTTRFMTFLEIARASNRKLLISFRQAYYLEALKPVLPELPVLNDDNIALYLEKCNTGTYKETDYSKWQRPFLDRANLVKAEDVAKNQGQYLACMGFFDMIDLVDMKPKKGSTYVHSTSENPLHAWPPDTARG